MKKRLMTLTTIMILGGVPRMFGQTAPGPSPCITGTLASYENSAPCSVGTNLEFGNFTFTAGTGLDDLITVTPVAQGLGGGFIFGGWQAADVGVNGSASYALGYTFAIFGDPPTVDAANLGMDPVTGSVGINERECPRGFDCFTEGVSSLSPPSTICDLPGMTSPCWEDSRGLPNISTAPVTDAITLTGNADGGAGFDNLTNTFDVVPDTPEPMTSMLGLGGMVAIGLARRYRRMG